MTSSKEAPIKEDEIIENKPMIKETPKEETLKEEAKTGNKPELSKQFTHGQQPLQTQTEDVYDAKIILDYDGAVDITRLENANPAYAYRYLNTDSANIATKTSNLLYAGGGWQIVPRDHALSIGIREEQLAPDGTYRLGKDLILARMPKDLYEKKMKHKTDKANKKMDAIDDTLSGDDKSLKGYGHKDMEGIKHKKDLPSTKW